MWTTRPSHMMLLVLVSLPLLVVSLEDTNLNYVHNGDAMIKSASQRVSKESNDPLPAYVFKPMPNHKFKYANFKYTIPTAPQNPSSLEFVVSAPLNVEEPPQPSQLQQPFIPTPYFLPGFIDMPLYEGYRMLMNKQALTHSSVDYLGSDREPSSPKYADYMGINKLLEQIAMQKVPKKGMKEDV